MLDVRTAQNTLENALRDAVLFAMGKRLPGVATVAALRAVVTKSGVETVMHDDMLIPIVVSDVVTASYRWNQASTGTDNGTSIVKPNDVASGSPGRWLSWTSPLRFSPVVGGDAYYLHEIETGFLERVIVLDKGMTEQEITTLIFGQVPSVFIEAHDDSPEESELSTGYRWLNDFSFNITAVAQNGRDRRQAAQGSTPDNAVGTNSIDGFIWALLGGGQLYGRVDGVRDVRVDRGFNWVSEEAQRRVFRQRSYVVRATVENPAAPNDVGPVEQVDFQAHMATVTPGEEEFDPDNYVASGINVSLGVGLSKNISAGTAYIDATPVSYAGALHTFSASVFTYRDLNPDGTLTFVESISGEDEPAITAGALRVGVTETDAVGVVDDHYVTNSFIPYGSIIEVPLEE